MECFIMYWVLVNVFIVVIKVSAASDIQFKGTEPKTPLLGGNVTFRWLYTGNGTPGTTVFHEAGKTLLYYRLQTNFKPQPDPIVFQYAEAVNWTGNISTNEYAFTLVMVKEFSHEKNFSVEITTNENFKTHRGFTKELLYISVPPDEITLEVNKTSVTVTMECRLQKKGRPRARISWYHNEKLVPEANTRYLYKNKEIEKKDNGSYRCVAKNDAAELKSEVKYISVREKKEEKEGPAAGKSSGGLGGGAIAGIVVAILIVIIIILVAVVLLMKKRGSQSSKSPTADHGDEGKSMVPPQEKDQVWL